MVFVQQIQKNALTEEQIMEEIIQEKTIVFFMDNDRAQLSRYINHLKTDTVWGSEETVLTLHRAITGEKYILNQWVRDTNTVFLILKDGKVEAWDKPENTDIILNNRGNNHWVSCIPSRFLVPNSKIEALTEFKNVLEKIIKRFHDLFPETPESESNAVKYIKMLQKKTIELDRYIKCYSNKDMNRFINDFAGKLDDINRGFSFFDRKYFFEHIGNFISESWHMIKLAFATLIYIVNPDVLKRLQSNRPVEYGIKTDIKKAQELFGYFKTDGQIKEALDVRPPITRSKSL